MRAELISGPCPGFGFRKCLHCKNTWLTTASDNCMVINRYCPQCIPMICETVKDWQLDARYGPLPDQRVVAERIERRMADRRIQVAMAKHKERREQAIKHQLEEIERRRRTA